MTTYQITEFTYGSAIQEICRLVGHPRPTDAAGSTDPAVQTMGAAVNFALRELLNMYEWQDLTVKSFISVVADSSGQLEKGFDLPEDFYRFIDQTQWSDQSLMPAGGPVPPASWMAYMVRQFTPVLTMFWQMRQDQLWIMSPPYPDPFNFEFMYLSVAQVIDADDATLLKSVADKNGDTFKLDSFMIMLLARARYLEWKGFDSSAAMRDFLGVYNSRAGADKGAPVISLNRPVGLPLITPTGNLPVTGYGS